MGKIREFLRILKR